MRRMLRRTPGSMLILVVLAGLWTAVAGSAHAEYPVVYNFFAGIPYELSNPGGSLPGSNDWNCKPTAAHPDPVVLVHGTAGGAQTNWGAYVPLLANEGYCVYSLTYGALDVPWPLNAMGGMKSIESSGQELASFVARVRVSTGAAKVDFIAHSQGNIVAQYYIKRLGGSGHVGNFVALAAPWLGTYGDQMKLVRGYASALGVSNVDAVLSAGVCIPCTQMTGGADFMTELNSDGIYDPTVSYTNIIGIYDELVVPYSIGVVEAPNAVNHVVQEGCPTDLSDHLAIAGSPRAAAFALNGLDPEHQRDVSCGFVAPFTG
ncbi:esterase/lipase family protein [Nocardia inohanensis]|uniref:esterase/lipase family protein n=1 Tax=Nocardia inohanensis TaxID=209246 RepID=UPI0008356A8D|nr:lipase [Nocardia inohanensis]